MNTIGLYVKALAAALVAGLMSVIQALQDGHITSVEWTVIAGAVLVSAGAVWRIPNVPTVLRAYGKAAMAGLVAVLAVLGTALVDGTITPAEWINAAIALAAGSGLVTIAPNASQSDWTDASAFESLDTKDL